MQAACACGVTTTKLALQPECHELNSPCCRVHVQSLLNYAQSVCRQRHSANRWVLKTNLHIIELLCRNVAYDIHGFCNSCLKPVWLALTYFCQAYKQAYMWTLCIRALLVCVQVAQANAAVRQQLCRDFFAVLQRLEENKLSPAAKTELQQQLNDKARQTQCRSALCDSCTAGQVLCQLIVVSASKVIPTRP